MKIKSSISIYLCFTFLLNVTQLYSEGDTLKSLGHASIKIKTSGDKVIYIDPFAGTDYSDSADIILVTHQHGDHNRINLVTQKTGCEVITNAQAIINNVYHSFTVGDIKIDAVAAYNSNHQKSQCVGYIIEFNGIKIYHAGDTDRIPEMADLAAREITYAMLPMDGVFNMGPEEATLAAGDIKAKFYIPIHTSTSQNPYSDENVARFTVDNKIIVKPGESIELSSTPTNIGKEENTTFRYYLYQNYPNPFNPSAKIRFTIPEEGLVSLRIYNTLGQEIIELVNEDMKTGTYEITWNAEKHESGVYFYTLKAGNFTATKKMILLK